MTQRIESDQFGRPACLAAFAVSVGGPVRGDHRSSLAAPSWISWAAL